jgi:hypothetical protein
LDDSTPRDARPTVDMARASASELREDIERRRAEVVKRLNEIARARAEIAALEEALRARVRDDELDRLERMLRSPTSSDEFGEVMTMGEFGGGRASAREGEGEGEGEGESEEEEATAERAKTTKTAARRSKPNRTWKRYTEKEKAFILEKMWEQRCLGHWKHLWGGAGWKEAEKASGTRRVCDVFTVEMARELGKIEGRSANPAAVSQFFASHMRDDYIKIFKEKLAAEKATVEKRRVSSPNKRARASAPAKLTKRSRPKVTAQEDDLTIGVDGLELGPHMRVKLLKTTRLVTGRDGKTVREKIPGVLFCNRCKRTNVDNGAQFNSSATCIPCADRMKELSALKASGITLGKSSAHRNDGTTGKRNLEWQVRNKEWFELVKAIRDGEDNKLADLKEHVIEMKQRFPNMVDWDQEIFCIAALESRHPIRVINWGLANGASKKEINENAVRAAVERKQMDVNTREGCIFVPALKVLKHLHRCNFPIGCDSLHAACAFGDVDCVRYLKENVECCDFTRWENYKRYDGKMNELMLVAAQEGHVEVLKFLYDEDCDFSIDDAGSCLELAAERKPERAPGYEAVKEWIQSLPEWKEWVSEKDRED